MDTARLDEIIRSQLGSTLSHTDFPGLGEKYEGKVRDCYVTGTGAARKRTIIVSDRVSTFDVVVGTIPFKGQVLNQMAQYWFEETANVAPNHMISVPDPTVMVVSECVPLKVEFVMRSRLTGVTSTSIWRAYEKGDRMYCGHRIPDGMKKNQRLPSVILTPSTKATKGDHDVPVSREQLLSAGTISEEDFDQAAAIAARLFAFGQKRAAERGLILVDTKYEMGVTEAGAIVVIDEIHTPDSSRYWFAKGCDELIAAGQEPRSLDKEFIRRWLVDTHGYSGDGPPPALTDEIRSEAARRYIEIYELVTGHAFVPNREPSLPRIAANLAI